MAGALTGIGGIQPPEMIRPAAAGSSTGEFRSLLAGAIQRVEKFQTDASQSVDRYLSGEGEATDIEITFPGLAQVVQAGSELLIDDGRVRVRVESVSGSRVECVVELGGLISSGKGVNLPGTRLPIPSLTGKDRSDLDFALAEGVDYVALSFVRSAQDIVDLRDRIATARSSARIIAKIEKGEAVVKSIADKLQ